jgi:hypothetical protein
MKLAQPKGKTYPVKSQQLRQPRDIWGELSALEREGVCKYLSAF